ncbi:response regulator [Ureibacillus sp. Re31]|uniref:Response regulator n=1 Tax=Ureibacillus galli TaxID=2762222 RepID=A0ABR8XH96_9BACL|nr:response regulator [Ureibacillus galli]MBD8028591.1 response regulator [Ureibacillus galli]
MIRAILADDEPLSIELMKKRLTDMDVEIIGAYTDAYSLISDLKNISFNTAFLDIQMPGISGMDLAALIHEENPAVQIVFVTAHRDYAIQAFELETTDYLLKPVLKERLHKTIDRIKERLKEEHQSESMNYSDLPSLEIRCFKQFSLSFNGEPILWKSAKIKELFAFFLMHLDTPIHRDLLIDKLWQDHDYKKAKIHLHTCISYIRKMLESFHPDHTLSFAGQHYTLHLEEAWCDVVIFEHMPTDISFENVETIESDILLYTGDYLEEEGYEWARAKANELSGKFISTLYNLADYYEQEHLENKYTAILQKILQFNPYSESAVARLMKVYIRLGMRADALHLYESFKQSLVDDLGIFPKKETSQIYTLIKQGDL